MWNIKDKTCLITGATSGIGRETALELSRLGAHIVFTYRDPGKAEETKRYISDKTGNETESFFCDFSSFQSVRDFVHDFKLKHDKLHVLVNNSGIYETARKTGKDGFELNWTVNHLAPFLLTNLLIDLIRQSSPSRIITVASESHRNSIIDFTDTDLKNSFSGPRAYGQSKLANILFTRQLAIILEGSGVTANCLHPGIVRTNIFSGMNSIAILLFKTIMISPEKGAETSVFLATSPDVENISGEYFRKRKIVPASGFSRNKVNADTLWKLSGRQTGL